MEDKEILHFSYEDESVRVAMDEGRWFHSTDILGFNDVKKALLLYRGMPNICAWSRRDEMLKWGSGNLFVYKIGVL